MVKESVDRHWKGTNGAEKNDQLGCTREWSNNEGRHTSGEVTATHIIIIENTINKNYSYYKRKLEVPC